ncbi:Glucose/ribitol dehydrogenase, partial [Penicillium sp. CMV-2018d]
LDFNILGLTYYSTLYPGRMTSPKRSILITGRCSRGGVGNALALEFAAHGMRVFATARSTASLSTLEDKGIETFALDVTNAASIAAFRDEIVKRTGGKLDILFNNAGTIFQLLTRFSALTVYEAPAIEADPTRTRAMFDANVFGLFDMVSTFTPLLLASASNTQTPPVIINTSSILSRLPFAFSAAYNASKAAVASYSDTLRIELDPLGIKVVTVFMGEVATNLMSSDNISFGSGSIYIDAEENAKERSRNHSKNSLKPEVFARQIVEEVLVKNPRYGQGEYLWKGSNAVLIWFLNAVGWRKIFDNTVKKMVGLDQEKIRRSIFDKGQESVKLE